MATILKKKETTASSVRGKIESIESLKQKFPNEWVLLTHCEVDSSGQPVSGIVLRHGKNKARVYKPLPDEINKAWALYLGDIFEEEEEKSN